MSMFCFFCKPKPKQKPKDKITQTAIILASGCNDFLPLIFSFLNKKDLCSASLVCKEFAQIANSDIIWRPIAQAYATEQKFAPTFVAEVIHLTDVRGLLKNSIYRKKKAKLSTQIEEDEKTLAEHSSQNSNYLNDSALMIYYSSGASFGNLFSPYPEPLCRVNEAEIKKMRKELELLEIKSDDAATLETALKKQAST